MKDEALAAGTRSGDLPSRPDVQSLFHRLNDQLGVVLARAELLQARAGSESDRRQAEAIVGSTLSALATIRELRLAAQP